MCQRSSISADTIILLGLREKNWLVNSSWSAETDKIIEELSTGKLSPALAELIPSCSVVSSDRLVLLSSDCILAC